MSEPVGRNKAGELIRVYRSEDGSFNLEVGGVKKSEFSSRSEAIKRGKLTMVKSFVPGVDEKKFISMLDTDVIVDYDFKQNRPSTFKER